MDPPSLIQASPWLAVPLMLAGAGISAMVSGRGALRTVAAVLLALPWLAVPFLVPASMGVYRFFLTMGTLLPILRVVDRAREGRPIPLWHRVWAATAPFETRAVKRAPPRLDGARLAASAGYGALAAVGFWTAFEIAPRAGGGIHYLARWGGGALFCYSLIDAVVALLVAVYRAIGLVLPPLHREPVLSRSLQEFWGERWNLTMRDWFHRHCFMPLARRRRLSLGVLAAFGASTLIHVWIALAVAGWALAAVMGAFFVVQGALTLIERRIGVLAWPPAAGHAWTVLCMLGTSPLFVEPVLRGFHL